MSGHRAPVLLLDEQQKMLAKTAHDFVRTRAPAARLRSFRDTDDPVGFSRELWAEMAELGWLGLQIPEKYGGLGLGFFDLCVLLEQTGRELMPEPFVSTLLLGAQALLLGGSEDQKKAWLPGIVAGEKIIAVGYQEQNSDDDLWHPETIARAHGNHFELTGVKIQALDAHVADAILVSAATSGTPTDAVRSSLFLVDPKQSGVTVTRQHRIDGRGAASVELDRVRVERDAIVGEPEGAGWLLGRVIERASVGLAAQMLGGAEQALRVGSWTIACGSPNTTHGADPSSRSTRWSMNLPSAMVDRRARAPLPKHGQSSRASRTSGWHSPSLSGTPS